MRKIQLLTIVIAAATLMGSSSKQLEFERAFNISVSQLPNLGNYTQWYKPDSSKVWKIESIMYTPPSGGPAGIIDVQINAAIVPYGHVENRGNINFPFWLGSNDSIRFRGLGVLAVSIIEFNVVP